MTAWVAVTPILSKLSRCSSKIFDKILLFLFFILPNNYSQVYVQPKSSDRNEAWLWSEGYFSLIKEGLWKSSRETWSSFSVEYLIATLCISFENLQVMYLCQLEKESQINQKKLGFFLQSWNLFSNSRIKMESKAAYFLLFTVTVFSECMKIHKLIYRNLSRHCTVLSPCPGFSPDGVNKALVFGNW